MAYSILFGFLRMKKKTWQKSLNNCTVEITLKSKRFIGLKRTKKNVNIDLKQTRCQQRLTGGYNLIEKNSSTLINDYVVEQNVFYFFYINT